MNSELQFPANLICVLRLEGAVITSSKLGWLVGVGQLVRNPLARMAWGRAGAWGGGVNADGGSLNANMTFFQRQNSLVIELYEPAFYRLKPSLDKLLILYTMICVCQPS